MRHGLSARLRRARAHLPAALDPLIERARDLVHDSRSVAALSRWVMTTHEGPLPHGGPPVRVCYLGRERFEEDALIPFRQHAAADAWSREVLEQGGLRDFLAAQRDPTSARRPLAPVLLVDPLFDWIGGLGGAFRFPVFLRGALPVAPSFEEQLGHVRSKPYRRVLKRAQRRSPTWRVSRDPADLRDFHEAMYRPLALQRFGDAATLTSRERLHQTLADRGELLLVEEGGRPVIGALLYRSARAPGTLFNWKYGVRDPAALDAPALRELTASLEVALFAHAQASGDERIDFGLTNAIANDGVYVHKRRIGCDFTPLPRAPELLLRFRDGVAATVLERAPIFVRDGAGLRCLAGYTGARGGGGEPFTKGVLRECTFAGCEVVSLYLADGVEDDVTADVGVSVEVVAARRPAVRGSAADEAPPSERGAGSAAVAG